MLLDLVPLLLGRPVPRPEITTPASGDGRHARAANPGNKKYVLLLTEIKHYLTLSSAIMNIQHAPIAKRRE